MSAPNAAPPSRAAPSHRTHGIPARTPGVRPGRCPAPGIHRPPPQSPPTRARPGSPRPRGGSPRGRRTFAGGDVAEADLGGLVAVLVGALGPAAGPGGGPAGRALRHGRAERTQRDGPGMLPERGLPPRLARGCRTRACALLQRPAERPLPPPCRRTARTPIEERRARSGA